MFMVQKPTAPNSGQICSCQPLLLCNFYNMFTTLATVNILSTLKKNDKIWMHMYMKLSLQPCREIILNGTSHYVFFWCYFTEIKRDFPDS
ncbi:hypothetical protein GDO81_012266 [Engystomops pustulosus]|uniref:Uncharacterized protein n=1 Tax=Engystomops pustulosus TaxID=76066 RepID=A0AAV7BKQ4_ENGPU|nr:hypothetical protein GDO81_012266 [Engystomops pustulosus]